METQLQKVICKARHRKSSILGRVNGREVIDLETMESIVREWNQSDWIIRQGEKAMILESRVLNAAASMGL